MQTVAGDLDRDGIDDLAYVVEWHGESGTTLTIGVLRGSKDGLVPWTHTKPLELGQRGPEISISEHSLYVNYFRNGVSWGHWQTDQFSYRKKQLVLVGTEAVHRSPRLDFEPGPVTQDKTSTNYLTGIEIRTHSEGRKKSTESTKLERGPLVQLEQYRSE